MEPLHLKDTTDTTHDGVMAAQGVALASGTDTLQTSVTGPGMFTFWCPVRDCLFIRNSRQIVSACTAC